MPNILAHNSTHVSHRRRKLKEIGRINISSVSFPVTNPRSPRSSVDGAEATNSMPSEAISNMTPAVQVAMGAVDADAQSVLMKLRELVVGPSQQLNEARLEELISLCELRDEQLHAALRDMEQRNAELEYELKKLLADNNDALRLELQEGHQNMAEQSLKTAVGLREDIGTLREETNVLVQVTTDAILQKIDAAEARANSSLTQRCDQLQMAMGQLQELMMATVENERRATNKSLGRFLQEAGESLAHTTQTKAEKAR